MNRHPNTLEERQEQMRSRMSASDRPRPGAIIPLYADSSIAGRVGDEGQKYAVIFDDPTNQLPVVVGYTNEPGGASYLGAARSHRLWREFDPRVVQIRRRRCFKSPVCVHLGALACGVARSSFRVRCTCVCHTPEAA